MNKCEALTLTGKPCPCDVAWHLSVQTAPACLYTFSVCQRHYQSVEKSAARVKVEGYYENYLLDAGEGRGYCLVGLSPDGATIIVGDGKRTKLPALPAASSPRARVRQVRRCVKEIYGT